MEAPPHFEPFPVWALLPKKETEALAFIQKYPEYDGRGVKIAILDSGVDPGADGLQITSDGKPKIIDMIDASGAGDVDTSTIVEATDGVIKGLTGRELRVPKEWTNPSGKYHIGVKNIYELYPNCLRERMKEEYMESGRPMHTTVITDALRLLQAFESSHSDPSEDNTEQNLIREDLKSKVDYLKDIEKKFPDLGPTYDCVVFNDGQHWKAVIDTTGVGELEKCTLLGNYRECLRYGTISDRDLLNYALNIHSDGNLLEIVSMSCDHGTHVASIAAAYFPEEPDKNGVAPGAQIVSISIADNRLGGGNQTGQALVRALIKVIESGCQVVNMSYSYDSHYNEGRVLDLIDEVVNKYGVIYVSSASNSGPALSTVGCPSAMLSESIIGAGAFLLPDMMTAEHSLRSKSSGMAYTWTSRGPTVNGDLGVSVCAPGGAITSVPNFMLKKAVLMSGTSMSSPNAAGSVCLLLSGLKAQGIAYSPYSVRRSIENTALKIPNYEPLTHGHGLIQVEKAFEHLVQHKDSLERDLRFHITTNGKFGIYLRQADEVETPSVHQIVVEPIFLNQKLIDQERKVNFEINLSLISNKEWVSCPPFLNLTYDKRSFTVRVDPLCLPEGSINFAFIKAYDVKSVEKGPVFQIPVTIIRPLKVDETQVLSHTETYKPGYLKRQFFDIPSTVTSAVVRVKNCDQQESSSFILHALQLLPHKSIRTYDFKEVFELSAQEDNRHVISLESGRTLELCFGKFWSSLGELRAQLSIEFHTIQPSLTSVTMMASECIKRIDVKINNRYEEIDPRISVDTLVGPLRPSESKVRPLGSRDVIPEGRQIYEIQLTYTLQLFKSSLVKISCPSMDDLVYDCEYEPPLWMIFDSNKQHLGSGLARTYNPRFNLKEGEYVIKLQIRHELVALLERLTDLPIQVQQRLPSTIWLKLYDSYRNAISNGKEFSSQKLRPHSLCPIYVTSLASYELPIGLTIKSGSYLLGYIKYSNNSEFNWRTYDRYSFKYVIDSEPPIKATKETNNEKSIDEQYSEALNELKISWVSKLKGQTAEDLFNELQISHKSNPQLLLNRIQSLDSEEDRIKHLKSEITLANDVLDLVKVNELLLSFAIQSQKKSNNSGDVLKNVEKQKTQVLDALVKKGLAICDLIDNETTAPAEDSNAIVTDETVAKGDQKVGASVEGLFENLNQVYDEISKVVDPYDLKVAKFTERHALAHKHFGRALKVLAKVNESKASEVMERKTIAVLKHLDWTHLESALNRSLGVKYPKNYRLF